MKFAILPTLHELKKKKKYIQHCITVPGRHTIAIPQITYNLITQEHALDFLHCTADDVISSTAK